MTSVWGGCGERETIVWKITETVHMIATEYKKSRGTRMIRNPSKELLEFAP